MHQYALPPIPPVSPFASIRACARACACVCPGVCPGVRAGVCAYARITCPRPSVHCLSIQCETFSWFVSQTRRVHCNSPYLTTCLIPDTFPCNAHGVRLVALTSLRDTYVCICATVGRVSSLSIQWFGICYLSHW